MIWFLAWPLGSDEALDLPGDTPCVTAPSTLDNPEQILSARTTRSTIDLRWRLLGGTADSRLRIGKLATTTATRVLVYVGGWRLVTREKPS